MREYANKQYQANMITGTGTVLVTTASLRMLGRIDPSSEFTFLRSSLQASRRRRNGLKLTNTVRRSLVDRTGSMFQSIKAPISRFPGLDALDF